MFGIDMFLGISLLACLFDKHFPTASPYVYQIGAIVGFVQLFIMKESMDIFGDLVRFWSCLAYLIIVTANLVLVNVYIAFSEKMWSSAKILFACVTFPTILIATFFAFGYGAVLGEFSSLPRIPVEVLFVILVVCSVVMGIGVYASSKLQTMKSQPKKTEVK